MKQFNLIIATVCVQLDFHQALWLTMTSNPLIWLPGVQRDNIPLTSYNVLYPFSSQHFSCGCRPLRPCEGNR